MTWVNKIKYFFTPVQTAQVHCSRLGLPRELSFQVFINMHNESKHAKFSKIGYVVSEIEASKIYFSH